MTSRDDSLKTNEFLRLRKLRLQQVREQSKDIAKKIRQRAKVEQLRHVSDVHSNKEKEYLQRQEKLVNRLEQLYTKSLENVGASHKKACEVNVKEIPEKSDLSKLRGREAAAILKRKKQEKLDEQKKLLDRKLQAREAANEISREKFHTVANTLTKSSSGKSVNNEACDNAGNVDKNVGDNIETHKGKSDAVEKNDMGTQWEFEEIPNEWEPNIPTLAIPHDDSIKNSGDDNVERLDPSHKSRRLNLFALSDEMPSSLRGGLTSIPDERPPIKPSLTLVSEYLQSRGLRLREPEKTSVSKKNPDDLQSIKQTLLRTRASRTDVSGKSNAERFSNADDTNRTLNKKSSVTIYDHNTRDTRDLPRSVEKLVVRDEIIDDDAYSQAVKESSVVDIGKSHHNINQEARSRLAITRQNVDKEYRDTLAFLNSLPKEKPPKCIRTAYMDADREQELKDKRQHKLQQEYRNIERQNKKHHCKHARNKPVVREHDRSKSKSPVTIDIDNNNIINKDFQYSWLPVPESDDNMAIHTIQNNTKNNKSGNTVKFSSVDTYHEYRSRHKHTPPTKDYDIEPNRRVVEALIIHENSNDSGDISYETDTSSVENLQLRKDRVPSCKANQDTELEDAERIIIYKVMESKKSKNKKQKIKKKSQNEKVVDNKVHCDNNNSEALRNSLNAENINKNFADKVATNTVSFTHLQEGVYKTVSAKGDNITSLYFSDTQNGEGVQSGAKITSNGKEDASKADKGTIPEDGDSILNRKPKLCKCKNTDSLKCSDKRVSAATSTTSFKSAVNDKASLLNDDGCIKFIDDGGNDARKFYVGASGFLKDDAYEVIIQLRKKDGEKVSKNTSQDKNNIDTASSAENIVKEINLERQTIAVQAMDEPINPLNVPSETGKQIIAPIEQPELVSTQDNVEVPLQESVPINDVVVPEERIGDENKEAEPIVKITEISDKGVSTNGRDELAVPDNMPKVDSIPKPVTSIFTQTTPNSSFHRPVFMHLSSSTSTTYMSPPELILPRYLRKDSLESCDETYEPVSSNFNAQKVRTTSSKPCICGKCKSQKKVANAATPPNTTRSTDQTSDIPVSEVLYKKCTNRRKNIKTHTCRKRSDPKICSKQKFRRGPCESKRVYCGSSYSPQTAKKGKIINNFDEVTLNPVVENYVKKLLALNKEGLKAIEVVNQECSAVNTPGSSVIDVSSNFNKNTPNVCNKISLEQIKNSLEAQLLENIINRKNIVKSTGSQTDKNIYCLYKSNKKRPVHKVKSFNISKQLMRNNKEGRRQLAHSRATTTSACSVNTEKEKTNFSNNTSRSPQHKNLPRQFNTNQEIFHNTSNSETSRMSRKCCKSGDKVKSSKTVTKISTSDKHQQSNAEKRPKSESYPVPRQKAIVESHSSESEASNEIRNRRNLSTPPISISTQTNQVDSEIEFMKLAENKLQNMEKIADLTEKCTKRLSNLAKVLEEVRRNKSLAYSQVSTSDCTSDSDHKSEKNIQTSNNLAKTFNPTVEIQTLSEALSSLPPSPKEQISYDGIKAPTYVPILTDLPKPDTFKTPSTLTVSTDTNNTNDKILVEQQLMKNRGKPPPALNRINLKHVPEGFVIPHELSTVVEVDSPMSIKVKSHTTHMDNKQESTHTDTVEDIHLNRDEGPRGTPDSSNKPVEPSDLITKKFTTPNKRHEKHSTDTSEDSKVKMMDLRYFNEIMLKPFISLKDYAKQYNLEELDGQTSVNGVSKDENVNEELSSLQSEASIPDVVAELLRRNLISEPFKFETTSNVNSTTVSSESTLSMLALSKAHKDKKKSAMIVKNKENIAETSVSLSISSNPDLEHAFQRLGMGWASSTLKKTKERLALSSSSNTSSSSIPQFKTKSFNYQDIPELSSLLNVSNKNEFMKSQADNVIETPKNALQQTSLTNSMTVKEFLTNELANKMTFSNKTNRNTTDQEFISLYETKIPEEMKYASQNLEVDEKCVDSPPSGSNNRARTSTPLQILKSIAYHSSSSSNTSNGLFSNADDLSSVKGTSNSIKNHSTSDKDDLTIPNYSLKIRKEMSECDKSD